MWDLIVSVPDHCLSFYFLYCYITVLKVKPVYQQMTLSPKLGVVEISTLWHFRLPLLIQMFIKVASSPRLSGIGMPSPILWSHLLKMQRDGPYFDLYQSLNRLPIWNSQNCSMFPLAFVAGSLQGHWWGFISRNYVVWPIFFLMNVFIALKGTHFVIFICLHCSWCCAVWRP